MTAADSAIPTTNLSTNSNFSFQYSIAKYPGITKSQNKEATIFNITTAFSLKYIILNITKAIMNNTPIYPDSFFIELKASLFNAISSRIVVFHYYCNLILKNHCGDRKSTRL